MLISGNSLLDKKVLSVQGNKKVGTVQDLLYDPSEQRVRALILHKGGWLSEPKLVLLEDLVALREEAVLVDSEQAVKAASADQRSAMLAQGDAYLTKSLLVTDEGKELGHITDLYFDNTTGKVEEFAVGRVKGKKDQTAHNQRIKAADIISIGKDKTIVAAQPYQTFPEYNQEVPKQQQNTFTSVSGEPATSVQSSPPSPHTESQQQPPIATSSPVKPMDNPPAAAQSEPEPKQELQTEEGKEELEQTAQETAETITIQKIEQTTVQMPQGTVTGRTEESKKEEPKKEGEQSPFHPVGNLGGQSKINLLKGKTPTYQTDSSEEHPTSPNTSDET